MSDETLELYIRQLIESHRTPEVEIAWQGGEPTLMGLEFFRRAVELGRSYAPPGMTVRHTIQTNGTKINGDWARFFAENGFLVGLSIDGPRELHDAYRRDKAGKPTFDKVMRGLDALREHGVDVERAHHGQRRQPGRIRPRSTASCATTAAATSSSSSPSSSVPARTACRRASEVTERSVTPEGWGQFLIGVFDEWVRRDVGAVFVQLFDVALANWYGEPSGLCVHTASCGAALAMELNGDVYACDHFVEPEYLRGNIHERHLAELVSAGEQIRFGDGKQKALPRYCRECDVRFACHGGCIKDRIARTPDGRAGAQLPLPRLQGVLPPRRRADAAHVRPAAAGTRAGGHRRGVPRRGVVRPGRARPRTNRYRIRVTTGLPWPECVERGGRREGGYAWRQGDLRTTIS